MISYIEQIQILRDVDRDKLTNLVNEFSIGKCIKKVQYYRHPNTDIVDNYEAYIWYTLPKEPSVSLTGSLEGTTCNLELNISCNIQISLKEVKIKYNTTGDFALSSNIISLIPKYGITTISLNIDLDNIYYFSPYITTCMGIKTGDIFSINN